MKTVDILTPQNVKLEFQLANFGLRLGGFVLDQIIFWLAMWLIYYVTYMTVHSEILIEAIFWLIVFPFFLFYSAIFELVWSGQTPGKRILGMRVVRLDGGKVGMDEVLSRWLLRLVDIVLTLGSLATLMITTTKFSQRVGDLLAGTIVVREKGEKSVSLSHVLNLDTVASYTPKYARARLLSEDEALLIKKVILRFEKKPNEGHRKAIIELSDKLQEILEIQKEEKKNTDFLRVILKDYIVLTR